MTDPDYDTEPDCETIYDFLHSIISMQHILPQYRPKYEEFLWEYIGMVVNGAVGLGDAEIGTDDFDPDRAGIAFFRY